MRVIQIAGGHKPAPNSRLNIFVHRQLGSLKALIPESRVLYAGLGSSLQDMMALGKNLRREIKAFRPDIVHSQYGTVTGAIAVFASGNIPTVVSFGGDEVYGTYTNEVSTKSARTSFALWFSKYCARKATVCIVKNESMRDTLRKWGAKQIEIIPNGVNLEFFKELPQEACRAQLGLKPEIQYVGFAVRENDFVKRLDLAKKAVELCNQHGLSNLQLLLFDNLDPKLMPAYLNAVNVLLLCSNHEGSPNIVKEGLACNRPVVSTDIGDVRERFAGVNGLFLVDQNAPAIAEGLKQAVKIEKSNGREFAKNLSEEIIARRLVDLYRAMLSNRVNR